MNKVWHEPNLINCDKQLSWQLTLNLGTEVVVNLRLNYLSLFIKFDLSFVCLHLSLRTEFLEILFHLDVKYFSKQYWNVDTNVCSTLNILNELNPWFSEGSTYDISEDLTYDISEGLTYDISEGSTYDISEDLTYDISEGSTYDISEDLTYDISEGPIYYISDKMFRTCSYSRLLRHKETLIRTHRNLILGIHHWQISNSLYFFNSVPAHTVLVNITI